MPSLQTGGRETVCKIFR